MQLGLPTGLPATLYRPANGQLSSSSHSRFPGFRRLTRDSRNRRLTRDSRIRLKINFFYRETGHVHRKNHQEKISEIFVHVDPEKT